MKFRKKPVVIEATRFDPSIRPFPSSVREGGWQVLQGEQVKMPPYWIATLEGFHEVTPGDWIIRGIKGEFYPCKPDIFEATYESLGEHDVAEFYRDDAPSDSSGARKETQ